MNFRRYEVTKIRGYGPRTDIRPLFNTGTLWTDLYEDVDDQGLTDWELSFKKKKKEYYFVEAIDKISKMAYYCIVVGNVDE